MARDRPAPYGLTDDLARDRPAHYGVTDGIARDRPAHYARHAYQTRTGTRAWRRTGPRTTNKLTWKSRLQYRVANFLNHLIRADAFAFAFKVEEDTVPERGQQDGIYVLKCDVVTFV